MDAPRAARRARRPGVRHRGRLASDLRMRARGTGVGRHRPRPHRRRQRDQHARGHGALRPRRQGDLGLPERRRQGRRGGRGAGGERRGRDHLRRGRRLGLDHVAGALPLDPAASARRAGRDRSHGHAVGLDRHAPVRRVHDRSVRGLELGPVLARPAHVVGSRARPDRIAARGAATRAGPGQRGRSGHCTGGGARRGSRRGRRS